MPVEVYPSIGVQPLEEEVPTRISQLCRREVKGASVDPVPLPDPLDQVLRQPIVRVRETTMTDQILLHHTRHRGRKPFASR